MALCVVDENETFWSAPGMVEADPVSVPPPCSSERFSKRVLRFFFLRRPSQLLSEAELQRIVDTDRNERKNRMTSLDDLGSTSFEMKSMAISRLCCLAPFWMPQVPSKDVK
jgi:hypothetical protein